MSRASSDAWRKRKRAERDPVFLAKRRAEQLRIKFGITLEQYDELLLAQGGLCAICRRTCRTGKALAVDHDHKTGVIRGLLCAGCNTAIGALSTAVLLQVASSYLAKYEEEVVTEHCVFDAQLTEDK